MVSWPHLLARGGRGGPRGGPRLGADRWCLGRTFSLVEVVVDRGAARGWAPIDGVLAAPSRSWRSWWTAGRPAAGRRSMVSWPHLLARGGRGGPRGGPRL